MGTFIIICSTILLKISLLCTWLKQACDFELLCCSSACRRSQAVHVTPQMVSNSCLTPIVKCQTLSGSLYAACRHCYAAAIAIATIVVCCVFACRHCCAALSSITQLGFYTADTMTVCLLAVIAMLLPFFNDIVGLLGSLGFWPLTVFLPIEMHIVQASVKRYSLRWCVLQTISVICFCVTIGGCIGSIAQIKIDVEAYVPFQTQY